MTETSAHFSDYIGLLQNFRLAPENWFQAWCEDGKFVALKILEIPAAPWMLGLVERRFAFSGSPEDNLHSRRRIDSWSPIFRSRSLGRSESLERGRGEEFAISNHVAAGCESTLSSCRLQEFHYRAVIMRADHKCPTVVHKHACSLVPLVFLRRYVNYRDHYLVSNWRFFMGWLV